MLHSLQTDTGSMIKFYSLSLSHWVTFCKLNLQGFVRQITGKSLKVHFRFRALKVQPVLEDRNLLRGN